MVSGMVQNQSSSVFGANVSDLDPTVRLGDPLEFLPDGVKIGSAGCGLEK